MTSSGNEAAEGGRAVLVVEDEWLVARELEAMLRRAGYAVVGPEARLDRAMRRAAEAPLAAAVLDINLAGERVFPVADALAARRIPFVFLTACGTDVVPERFWRRPTLRKPLSPKPLLALLEVAAAAGVPRRPAVENGKVSATTGGGARLGRSWSVAGATARGEQAAVVTALPPSLPTPAPPRPPRRQPNAALRPREHLTPGEVGQLVRAAARRAGRHGRRDAAMILLAYRHGLRAGELVALRRDQLDLDRGLLRVRRLRNGEAGLHTLHGGERRALLRLLRDDGALLPSPFVGEEGAAAASPAYVFVSERGGPMTPAAFRKQLAAAAAAAGLPFPVHPHMLRHACGVALARAGRDAGAIRSWLGHRNARHAARYADA